MQRIHAFEFHEQPACPQVVRESSVEALGNGLHRVGLYDALAPVFAEFCRRGGCDEILDLCSGSGEPMVALLAALEHRGLPAPSILLSDLFPNPAALAVPARSHPGQIDWVARPVDALRVPAAVDRAGRTLLTAFHHFAVPEARSILADAAAKGRAIFIAEAFVAQDPRTLAAVVPSLVRAGVVNPFVARRDRVWKLLVTYGVPEVPLCGLWDTVVSSLRGYAEVDLRTLVRGLGRHWEYHEVPFGSFGRATVFFGIPV